MIDCAPKPKAAPKIPALATSAVTEKPSSVRIRMTTTVTMTQVAVLFRTDPSVLVR